MVEEYESNAQRFSKMCIRDRAKLELSDAEKEEAKKDMEKMLDYIDTLNELDTDGVEPMSHVFPVHNVFREDVVTNGDGSADTLANAPPVSYTHLIISGGHLP